MGSTMNNHYYKQLIEILLAHPNGVRVGALVRTIYNHNCDLFHPETLTLYDSIYQSVYAFLWRNSKGKHPQFERKRRGVYALSKPFVRQLELCFDDWDEPMVPTPRKRTPKPDPYAGMAELFAPC